MIRHLPVLAAIFLALSGCKPKAIQGTVVVVNQPGQSVKLAGARIDVVSKAELRAMIDARRAQYRQAWESNQAALKLAENDLRQATAHSEQSRAQRLFEQDHNFIALKAQRDRVQQQISAYEMNRAIYNSRPPVAPSSEPALPPPSGNEAAAFFKDILSPSSTAQRPATAPPAVDLSKARAYAESISSKMDAIETAYMRSNDQSVIPALARVDELTRATAKTFPTLAEFFAGISPKAAASTTTDADGAFVVECPKAGHFVVFASANTIDQGTNEVCFWIVDIVPGQGRIRLTETNTIRIDGDEIKVP
jgi:hypothetical protein